MYVPFRGHVYRRANTDILKFLSELLSFLLFNLSETEISDLVHPIVDKNVWDFYIPVHNVFAFEVFQAFVNIDCNLIQFLLKEKTLKLESLWEITSIAELCDDVAVATTAQNIMTFYYIRMWQFLQDAGLSAQQLLHSWIRYWTQFNDLDSHLLVWINDFLLVGWWVALKTFEKLPCPIISLKQ